MVHFDRTLSQNWNVPILNPTTVLRWALGSSFLNEDPSNLHNK